jgi:hypothetical protein
MRQRTISIGAEQELAQRFRAGTPTRTLAEEYGVPRCVVYAALRRQRSTSTLIGRKRLMSNVHQTQERNAKIIAAYQAGATVAESGAPFGLKYTRTQKILSTAGVLTNRQEASADLKRDIAQRWAAGQSQSSIGRSLGISQNRVGRILHRLGYVSERRCRGPLHGAWKGGVFRDASGYVREWIPVDDPLRVMADASGYVLQHRLVMARHLGRPLRQSETVHHINSDRQNNRPENLQLRQGRHGKGIVLACADCGSSNIVPHTLAEY